MKKTKIRIGIDFHGVIDTYPELFAELSSGWIKKGHEVHILTGKEWQLTEPKLIKLGIKYTGHYSIVDHHLSVGTKMEYRSTGWWMEEREWNRSKGEYCRKAKITLHFDNDLKYAEWFPAECTFVLVREQNFQHLYEAFK